MTSVAAVGPTRERLLLAERVAELRAEGLIWREVAERLAISRSYASELWHDPDGSRSRARKESYQGECHRCGAPTTGGDGRNKTAKHCFTCSIDIVRESKYWTREKVIDAIQRFVAENGRPPISTDWDRSDQDKDYPAKTNVYRGSDSSSSPFSTWADAIEAAGYRRPLIGEYVRDDEWRRQASERRTVWTPALIEERLLAFAAERGRMPQQRELRPAAGLPHYKTVYNKLGQRPLRKLAAKHGLPIAREGSR